MQWCVYIILKVVKFVLNIIYRIIFNAIDTDECAEGTDTCDHVCINTNGSYVCSCDSNEYKLGLDKETCIGVFEYSVILYILHVLYYLLFISNMS